MRPRYSPQILSRGLTEPGDLVHLYRPQVRPGLKEGTDYPLGVACLSGAWHIKHTSVPGKVTCPACRETILFKSKINSEK